MVLMVKIIKYSKEFYEPLIDCINIISQENPWMVSDHFVPNEKWKFALTEQLSDAIIFLAVSANDVIGFCRLFPINSETLELGIGVAQGFHRLGIGSAMMRMGIDWAKESFFHRIVLETHTNNFPAHQIFSQFNFQFQVTKDSLDYFQLKIK